MLEEFVPIITSEGQNYKPEVCYLDCTNMSLGELLNMREILLKTPCLESVIYIDKIIIDRVIPSKYYAKIQRSDNKYMKKLRRVKNDEWR